MRFLEPLIAVLGLTGSAHDRPSPSSVGTLDAYITQETETARSCLLANIGPDGAKSHGALVRTPFSARVSFSRRLFICTQAGLVVASPSTQNPDYLYSWTRDSALVFKLLIEDFVSGDDPSLRGLIDAYIHVQSDIQQTSNPSGAAGKDGLGEPKFNIDGSPFLHPWGRPQRGTCTFFPPENPIVG